MNAPGAYDQAAKQVAQLRREIDELRAFEQEYRTSLAAHLDECLATLRGGDPRLALRAAARHIAEATDEDLMAVLTDLPEERREQVMKRVFKAMALIPVPEETL